MLSFVACIFRMNISLSSKLITNHMNFILNKQSNLIERTIISTTKNKGLNEKNKSQYFVAFLKFIQYENNELSKFWCIFYILIISIYDQSQMIKV